jgi:hypothetical protein
MRACVLSMAAAVGRRELWTDLRKLKVPVAAEGSALMGAHGGVLLVALVLVAAAAGCRPAEPLA